MLRVASLTAVVAWIIERKNARSTLVLGNGEKGREGRRERKKKKKCKLFRQILAYSHASDAGKKYIYGQLTGLFILVSFDGKTVTGVHACFWHMELISACETIKAGQHGTWQYLLGRTSVPVC